MEVSVSDFGVLDGSDAAKDALRESIAAAAATDVDYVQADPLLFFLFVLVFHF